MHALTGLSAELILRLALAAFLGGIIGLEREYRAKEAGMRTHFLVSLGSALFMIVSQFGFVGGLLDISGLYGIPVNELPLNSDASRVAAQIVTGIGFIGAGTIILHRRFVSGLTTAAGLWATSAVGVAVGGGMYSLAAAAAVMILIGFELVVVLPVTFGHITREANVVIGARNRDVFRAVVDGLRAEGMSITAFSTEVSGESGAPAHGGYIRMSITIGISDVKYSNDRLIHFLLGFEGLSVEKLE